MPKQKTHQGTSKRLRLTKTGKIMHRTSGQDHFNSRETSKVRKNKRSDSPLHATHNKLRSLIPHK